MGGREIFYRKYISKYSGNEKKDETFNYISQLIECGYKLIEILSEADPCMKDTIISISINEYYP